MKIGAFMKNKITVAVIGCGAMGSAVASCLLNPATAAAQRANGNKLYVTVCDNDESRLLPFNGRCDVMLSAERAIAACEYIIVALTPACADALSRFDFGGKTVISLMAGVSVSRLAALTHCGKIVRAMPNLNAAVGEAYTAYCAEGLSEAEKFVVAQLLGSLGMFEEMPEHRIDVATGLTGCAPAFVFSAIKAFCDEAVARGFAPDRAKRMAVQVFYGSALAAERHDGDLGELISAVATPGGATAAGFKVLQDGAFESTLRGAIGAAIAHIEGTN